MTISTRAVRIRAVRIRPVGIRAGRAALAAAAVAGTLVATAAEPAAADAVTTDTVTADAVTTDTVTTDTVTTDAVTTVTVSTDTVSTERSAVVEWLRVGPVEGVGGNVHAGRVQTTVPVGSRTPTYVYGETLDYTCPVGYAPTGLWLEAVAQLDAACTLEDNLIIETGDLDLRVGGRLHTARLVGDLGYIHGYAVGDPGTLSVDLRWDAPGEKTVTREVFQERPRIVRATTTRDAAVTGTIGGHPVGSGEQHAGGVVQRFVLTARS